MCGIVGWIDIKTRILGSQLEVMANTLKHRGPDDEGYHFYNFQDEKVIAKGDCSCRELDEFPHVKALKRPFKIALAHRRLSILDLSFRGHQPMLSRDGNLVVVHNGEIYNYMELRGLLKSHGFQFITKTDTEVILNAYSHWGEKCFTLFNGMWAFALLDRQKKKFILSRDRFGKKPLYYFYKDGLLIFASEVKAILASGVLNASLNRSLALKFLALSMTKTEKNERETLFNDVMEIMPGTYYEFEFQGTNIKVRKNKYWSLETGDVDKSRSIDNWACEFRDTFDDSVRIRLKSDVPIAITLSGGLDSSSIAAVVKQLEPCTSFDAYISDGRPEDADPEFALRVASHLGLHHHLLKIDLSGNDLWNNIDKYIWINDEPPRDLGGSAAGARTLFKSMHQKGVKVALEGLGGDEILAGYPGYFSYTFLIHLLKEWEVGSFFQEYFNIKKNNKGANPVASLLLREIGKISIPGTIQNWLKRLYSTKGTTRNVFDRFSLNREDYFNVYDNYQNHPPATDLYERQKHFIFQHFFPAYLHYADRNGMEFSIENRLPFLDYRLVELCFRMPITTRFHKGYNKYILRLAFQNNLPGEVVWREGKQGFYSPPGKWIESQFSIIEDEIMDSRLIGNLLNIENLCEFLQHEYSKNYDFEIIQFVWRVYALSVWGRVFNVN